MGSGFQRKVVTTICGVSHRATGYKCVSYKGCNTSGVTIPDMSAPKVLNTARATVNYLGAMPATS